MITDNPPTPTFVERLRILAEWDTLSGEPLGKRMREAADLIDELTGALEKSALALDEAAKLLRGKGLGGCGSIMEVHAEYARDALTKATQP